MLEFSGAQIDVADDASGCPDLQVPIAGHGNRVVLVNATDSAALLTGLDTSFVGDVPRPDDEEVIRAISQSHVITPNLTVRHRAR